MYIIYAQLVQLVTVLLNNYRKVPSSTPAEAIFCACNLFFTKLYKGGCPSESTESPRSLWRVHRVYEESTESPHGIHETVFHGVLMESTVFQTVPLDSTWTPHGLYTESTQSPCRLLGTSWKWTMESSETPHGVSVESSWTP